MGAPIIGPPFSPQTLPSTVPEELQQNLATYFNLETQGNEYTSSFNQQMLFSTSSTLPPITPANSSSTAYLKAIAEAKAGFKEILDFNDRSQSLLNINRWYDNINFMNSLAALQTAMKALATRETQFGSGQKTQLVNFNNGPLAAYNSALTAASNQTAAMRQIQDNYLNGIITPEQYNLEVAAWNASAVTINSDLATAYTNYQAAVAAINAQITANNAAADIINGTRIGIGIQETIAQQQPIALAPAPAPLPTNVPLGIPPPTIAPEYLLPASIPTIPSVSTVGTGWQGSATAYMKNYYGPVFERELPAFLSYSEGLERQGAYRSLLLFTLAGKTATNIAYIDRFPKAPSNAGSASPNPAGGVALMAASLGLSNNALSGAISQNSISPILSELLKSVPEGIQEQTLQNTAIVVLKALQRSSLFTGAAALELMGNHLDVVSPGSTATEAVVGLAALKTLTGLIGSGALEQNIASAVTSLLEGAGLTKEQIAQAVQALTSGATLGILLLGVLNLARSLEQPGLVGQFLGQQSLDGVDINDLIGQATVNNIGTALQNPVTVLYLREFLTKEFSSNQPIIDPQRKEGGQTTSFSPSSTSEESTKLTSSTSEESGESSTSSSSEESSSTSSVESTSSSSEETTQSSSTSSGSEVTEQDIVNQLVKNQQIVNSTINSRALADTILNRTLESGRIQTELQLRDALAASLKVENFSEDYAQQVIDRAAEFLRNELSLPGLDTSFNDTVYRRQSLQSDAFLNDDVRPVLRNDYSFETVRDFRDQLSSDLVEKGVSPGRASELSNIAAATIQTGDLRRTIEGRALDRGRLEKSISENLQSQGFTPEDAQTIASNVGTTTAGGQYSSEVALRDAILTSLRSQGVSEPIAQQVQSTAITVPADTNLLKTLGNGNVLSQDDLIAQFTSDITKRLRQPLGPQEASNLANLGVLTLFGPQQSPQEKSINDVKENLSVKDQFQAAWDTFISKVDNKNTQETVISRFADQFRESIKGSFDAFDLAQRYSNPANNLVLCSAWGLMYSGVSGEPSNFKKDIDIRI